MGKKSFVFYNNWAVLFSSLDDKDAGALIKAICNHNLGLGEKKLDGTLDAIYQMIITTMNSDAEKYEETCEKRREAIKTRWNKDNQKNTNVYKCIQDDTNVFNNIQMHYDKDKDNDKEKDKDNDIYNIYESLQAYYNTLDLPKCKSLTKSRVDIINTLLEAFSEEEIKEVFKKASNTKWLCGDNDKHWKADFDWLINIDNFVRVQEGRYDTLGSTKGNDFKKFTQSNYDWDEINKELGIQ